MKKSTVIIMWGLITSLVSALFFEFLVVIGQATGALQYLSFLILFAGLFLGMKQYRDKANGGYASFGELYKSGIFMSFVMVPIGIIDRFLVKAFHPQYMQDVMDAAQAKMINKGYPDQQIEMSLKITRWFSFSPAGIIISGILGSIIIVLIMGLITAGLLSKVKPFMEEDNINLPS
jgi:hypothetical protein